jgi:hypothetical protein
MVCWHSARKPRSSGVSAAYQAWPVHVPFGYANLAGLLAKLNLHPAQVPRGGGASPFRAVRLQPFLAAAHRGPCQRSLDLNFRAQQLETAAALAQTLPSSRFRTVRPLPWARIGRSTGLNRPSVRICVHS